MNTFLFSMIDALTSAYTRKIGNSDSTVETNIGKLFSVLAQGLDSVKEQSELIQMWDDVDKARGSVLDRHGVNFGVKRMSFDDNLYRLAIKVKMMALLSGGDTDTVIQTVSALINVDPEKIDFEDVHPSKIAIYVNTEDIPNEYKTHVESIALTIKRVLSAGIGVRLYLRQKKECGLKVKIARCSFCLTRIKSKRIE